MEPGHDSMPGFLPWHFGPKQKSTRPARLQMKVRWLQFCHRRFWSQSINGVKTLHRCFVLLTGEDQFPLSSPIVGPLCGHHYNGLGGGRRHWGNRNRPQVAFPRRQKNKRWILQARNHHTGRTISWVSVVVMQ